MTKHYREIHSELIDRCKQQDQKAQVKIYELYAQAMYNNAMWILKDPMVAEEIMQDAFITAFKKIDSFKGESTFGAWLKRIVINQSINELKRNKLEFTDLDDKMNNIPDFDEETEIQDTSSVKRAILELPDKYRVVLTLYLIEGYDHEEIAQILSIGASTSRSQYLRAKKKLNQILKEKQYV